MRWGYITLRNDTDLTHTETISLFQDEHAINCNKNSTWVPMTGSRLQYSYSTSSSKLSYLIHSFPCFATLDQLSPSLYRQELSSHTYWNVTQHAPTLHSPRQAEQEPQFQYLIPHSRLRTITRHSEWCNISSFCSDNVHHSAIHHTPIHHGIISARRKYNIIVSFSVWKVPFQNKE